MPPVWNQRTPSSAEKTFPVDVTRFDLTRGRVASIRTADRPADAESALREIQSIAHRAANPVERLPLDEAGIDAALQDEVLDQPADLVVGKGA